MPRTTPTKQQLNQAIRAGIPGGDYLLDLFNYLHIVRRYNLTDECRGFLDFIYNQFRLQREMLVRHLGFTGFSADEIAELKDLLIRNISRQLGVTL